jgi:hypothetical protein
VAGKHEAQAEAVAADADRLLPEINAPEKFGARFGFNLRNVKIHTDAAAARAADALGARAYTIGDTIAFAAGQLNRATLAHELAHVIAQNGGGRSPEGHVISPAPHGAVQRMPAIFGPRGGPPSSPPQELHFFHGSSWEIARTIPGNVDPNKGGGDFATGFYTHVDADDQKARTRAKVWGMRIARERKEPYAGVIDFNVNKLDYDGLLGNGKSLDFGLTRRDQADYQQRQRVWLDFITSQGRKDDPTFDPARSVWHHERRDPHPELPYNIVSGPFYKARRGLPGTPPARDDFTPYQEGQVLPQQVVWANDGAALLNSSKVQTSLEQYDAKTGDRVDPPKDTPAGPAAQTPNVKQYPAAVPFETADPAIVGVMPDR